MITIKIYLANGLFSQADRNFNKLIKEELKDFNVFLPQENVEINDKTKVVSPMEIYKQDKKQIVDSDVMVAVIDGVEIDSGVAMEIGIATQLNKPVFLLCTDIRLIHNSTPEQIESLYYSESPFVYKNLFVLGGVFQNGGRLVSSLEILKKVLQSYYNKNYIMFDKNNK